MKDPLIVSFRLVHTVLFMQVRSQPADWRCQNAVSIPSFVSSDGFEIRSYCAPDISKPNKLYVRGTYTSKDMEIMQCSFNNVDEARSYMSRACQAVREFNARHAPVVSQDTLQLIDESVVAQ